MNRSVARNTTFVGRGISQTMCVPSHSTIHTEVGLSLCQFKEKRSRGSTRSRCRQRTASGGRSRSQFRLGCSCSKAHEAPRHKAVVSVAVPITRDVPDVEQNVRKMYTTTYDDNGNRTNTGDATGDQDRLTDQPPRRSSRGGASVTPLPPHPTGRADFPHPAARRRFVGRHTQAQ